VQVTPPHGVPFASSVLAAGWASQSPKHADKWVQKGGEGPTCGGRVDASGQYRATQRCVGEGDPNGGGSAHGVGVQGSKRATKLSLSMVVGRDVDEAPFERVQPVTTR
jgi:hypothetical protein